MNEKYYNINYRVLIGENTYIKLYFWRFIFKKPSSEIKMDSSSKTMLMGNIQTYQLFKLKDFSNV